MIPSLCPPAPCARPHPSLAGSYAPAFVSQVAVPSADTIERAVAAFFGSAKHLPTEKLRSWVAVTAAVAPLFAPLSPAL